MKASIRLHDRMFQSLSQARMRFFNTNTSGRVLNRFSKDMGAIDEVLPIALIDCLQIGLSLLGIVAVVGVANYWLLIPTVIIGIIFYYLRVFYLATSRSVKRLDGVSEYLLLTRSGEPSSSLQFHYCFSYVKEGTFNDLKVDEISNRLINL